MLPLDGSHSIHQLCICWPFPLGIIALNRIPRHQLLFATQRQTSRMNYCKSLALRILLTDLINGHSGRLITMYSALNEWTNGRASRVPANTRLKGMKPVYGLHGKLPTPFDSQLFHLRIYSIVALNVRLYKRFRFVGLGLQSTRKNIIGEEVIFISRAVNI